MQELKDGAGELKDGLEQFNDEAIQKLITLLNDDLGEIPDRARAMIEEAKGYASYAGIAEGQTGVTQFIIKSAGI